MENLNAQQKQAIEQFGQPLLVLAGAGCGKTRVITQKIIYLIQNKNLSPYSIYAVTFTNKAAKEMKVRVSQELKNIAKNQGVNITTFHTLGMKILEIEHKAIGYSKNFTIFDQQDSLKLLKELAKNDPLVESIGLNKVANIISLWKNNFTQPKDLLNSNDAKQFTLASLYSQYQEQLQAYSAFDFDDLIVKPTLLLKENAEIREKWQQKITYLLVDEYQDTNICQYELLRQLVGNKGLFTVVGDDDQAIYGFRGACKENLFKLKEDFKDLQVIKLEQNYRSYGSILKSANHLIRNNPHVFEKKLWSGLGHGDPIKIMACKNGEEEAEKVIAALMNHKFQNGLKFNHYAILYRGNFQARVFEKILRSYNPPIPYQISGGTSWFDKAEIKDLIAYLRLLANNDDNVAFLRIINTPKREIGATTLAKLGQYAKERKISLNHACSEMGLKTILTTRAFTALHQFQTWLVNISDRAMRGDAIAAIEDMLKEIDYKIYLQDSSKDKKAAEKKWESIQEAIEWMRNLQKNADKPLNIQDYANHMTLMGIIDRDEEKPRDAIQLLTLHAAKGLEFPYVFLVGVEEELLPHKNSLQEDNIEEERRLCYVGITRAQKGLTLSYAKKRKRYDEEQTCTPSRFLQELPEEELNWQDKLTEENKAAQKEQGLAQLMKLKEMLGE